MKSICSIQKVVSVTTLASISFLVSACGGMALRLPSDTTRYENQLDIASKARALVILKTGNCKSLQSAANFTIRAGKKNAAALALRCENNRLLGLTDWLAPGSYTLQLSLRRRSLKELKPVVTVVYANPDFRSGPDQYADGAIPLEPNKALEGTVEYTAGDATDWMRVVGEKKRVFLTYTPTENADTTASVYRAVAGGKPIRLKALPVGKPTAFYLGKDDLLVKVLASNEDGAIQYSLVRRDEDAKKAISLQVVDAYPVSSDSSLVLLTPNPAVKAEDELRISAKAESGQWKELGSCRVKAVSPDSIQCELVGAWSEKFLEYRASGTAPVSG